MKCTAVKPGWYCAGQDGHEGPCAAWPPCWFCGYLGPGLRPLAGTSSVCGVCVKDIRPGDKTVPGGDVMWDGSLWDRIKAWFR